MIRTRTRLLLAVTAPLLAGGLAVGCGESKTDQADGPTELADAATTERTTATTAAPTTAVPTTTAAPTGMGSPIDAATRLFDAWVADDRATAATVAEPVAIEGIWAAARGDYGQYNQCDSAEFDTSGCLFRGAPGTIAFTMERRGEAWVVIEALYSEP
jgi:hypothetical protein